MRFTSVLPLLCLLTAYSSSAQCPFPSGVTANGTATANTTCVPATATGTNGSCLNFNEYATFTGLQIGQTYTMKLERPNTAGSNFSLGVYTSTTSATAPQAYGFNQTAPISVTFTATTTTVYAKAFNDICGSSMGADCNILSLTNYGGTASLPITAQPATTSVTAGTTGVQAVRVDVTACGSGSSAITSLSFSTNGSTNAGADISNAKVYYTTTPTFAATTQFGSTVSNPSGSFTVTGSQTVAASGTGYFWLVYDVPCGANVGDVLDAEATSVVINGTAQTPATTNPAGTRSITAAFATTRAGTGVTPNISPGTSTEVLSVNVAGSTLCPGTVTQFNFTIAGTAPAGTISSARVYYTQSSSSFSFSNQFGTAVVNPSSGTITFNGSQALAAGANYFWLVYNIPCSASGAGTISSDLSTLVVNGTTTVTPTGAVPAARTVGMNYGTSRNDGNSTTPIVPGSTNNQMVYAVIGGSNPCPGAVSQLTFTVSGTAPAGSISAARVYYATTSFFGTSFPFGTAIANPSGTITFSGSQGLSSGLNYFWLVYDVPCSASGAGTVNGDLVSAVVNGATITPTGTATDANPIASLYATTTTDGNSTTPVIAGSTNNQIAYATVTGSSLCPGTVSQLNFTVSGTAPAGSISAARAYYTTTSTFSTANPFGAAVANPSSGIITFNGSQALAAGANYFWLVYDLSCSASGAGTVNGDVLSVVVNGSAVTPTGAAAVANAIPAAAVNNTSTADGNWTNPAIWSCGSVPTASSSVVIANAITVNTSGNASGNVTINSGAALTIASGDLTMGTSSAGAAAGTSNRILSADGTLTITGGTLNLNGSYTQSSTGTLNMSAGVWNIDPNDGTSAGSAAGSTFVQTVTSANRINVTGGAINFLDPPYNTGASTGRTVSYSSGITNALNGTVTMGGGDDTNPANTTGFQLESATSGAALEFGNLVVAGGRFGAQRHASTSATANNPAKARNLTVNAGAEFVINSAPLAVSGNVVNNGVITTTSTDQGGNLILAGDAFFTSGTGFAANSVAQSISGTGFFKYLTASADPTAQTGNVLAGLTVYHTAASPGVTLNVPLTAVGFIQLYGGAVSTTATNFLALGSGTSLPGNPAAFTAGTGALYGYGGSGLQTAGSTFTTPGAWTGGWISGPFLRYVPAATTTGQAGLMPVGGGGQPQPAQILFSTAPTAPGYLSALWMAGSGISAVSPTLNEPAITPSLVNSATNAMWQVTANGSLSGGVYDARFNNRSGGLVTNFNQVTLLKRANSAAPWTLEGTHVATTGSNASPVIGRNGLSGFSQFAIGGNVTILPLVLKELAARAAGAVNLVSWTTGAEPGIAAFAVQRSADGKSFSQLAELPASGSGSAYSFTDETPLQGTGYYRLQLREDGGKLSYSGVVSVTRTAGTASLLTATPNPFTNVLTIRLAGGQAEGEIVLTNAVGATVLRSRLSGGLAELDLHSLPAGEYIVTCTAGTLREVLKVQKR